MPRKPPPESKKTQFKKGDKPNPHGSSARVRARKAAREAHKLLTLAELRLLTSRLFLGTPQQMAELANADDASVLVKLLATFLSGCSKKPDIRVLTALLEHTVGKPREFRSHEHSGPDGGAIVTTANMSDEDIAKELAAIRARRGEK